MKDFFANDDDVEIIGEGDTEEEEDFIKEDTSFFGKILGRGDGVEVLGEGDFGGDDVEEIDFFQEESKGVFTSPNASIESQNAQSISDASRAKVSAMAPKVKEPDGSILDPLVSLQEGGASTYSTFGYTIKKAGKAAGSKGVEEYGEAVERTGEEAKNFWHNHLSDKAKKTSQEKFTIKDGSGNTDWVATTANIVNNPGKVLNATAGSAYGSALGITLGGFVGLGLKVGGVGEVAANTIGFSASEGAMSAAESAKDVETKVLQMPEEVLSRHPEWEARLKANKGDKNQTIKDMAEDAAQDAALYTGLSTMALSTPTSLVLSKVVAGNLSLGENITSSTLKAGAGEGVQEAAQSGAEKIGQNIAINQNANQSVSPLDDVAESAVSGAVTGAPMGAAVGAATYKQQPNILEPEVLSRWDSFKQKAAEKGIEIPTDIEQDEEMQNMMMDEYDRRSSAESQNSDEIVVEQEALPDNATTITPKETKLLSIISKAEGTATDDPYNVTLGYGKYSPTDRPITEMTLGEIKKYQKKMIENGGESSAVGRYQIIQDTLKDIQDEMGLSDDVVFDEETQDSMILHRLKNARGMDSWMNGKLSDADFQRNLAKEFASIPDPKTGKSFYGQGAISQEDTTKYLEHIKSDQEDTTDVEVEDTTVTQEKEDTTKEEEFLKDDDEVEEEDVTEHPYYQATIDVIKSDRGYAKNRIKEISVKEQSLQLQHGEEMMDKSDDRYKEAMAKNFKKRNTKIEPMALNNSLSYTPAEMKKIEMGDITPDLAVKIREDINAFENNPRFEAEREALKVPEEMTGISKTIEPIRAFGHDVVKTKSIKPIAPRETKHKVEAPKNVDIPAQQSVDAVEDSTPAPLRGLENDISYQEAYNSRQGISHTPERAGRMIPIEHAKSMTDTYNSLLKYAKTPEDVATLDEMFTTYRSGMVKRRKDLLAKDSRTLSTMITGSANFNVRRNEKKQGYARAAYEEISRYDYYMTNKIKSKLRGTDAIKATDDDAVEKLQKKVDILQSNQEKMKAANKIIKSKSTPDEKRSELANLGFKDDKIDEIINPKQFGGVGFASFQLTNNNNRLKDAKARLEEVKAKKEKASEVPIQDENTFEGGKLVYNNEIDRVQFIFDGKPEADMIAKLKKNGFKWAPSQKAWQRQLTDNGKRAAKQILKTIKSEESKESEETTSDDTIQQTQEGEKDTRKHQSKTDTENKSQDDIKKEQTFRDNMQKIISDKLGDINIDNAKKLYDAMEVAEVRTDAITSAPDLFGQQESLLDIPSETKLKTPKWAKGIVSNTVRYEDIVTAITDAKNGKPSALADRAIAAYEKENVVLPSKSIKAKGITSEVVHDEAKKILGESYQQHIDNGLVIVQSWGDLPSKMVGKTSISLTGTAAGLFDPSTNTAYIIADNISKKDVQGVVLHELLHKSISQLTEGGKTRAEVILGAKYKPIVDRLDELHKAGDKQVTEAVRRAKAAKTPEEHMAEETMAYLLGNITTKSSPKLYQWYQSVIADIKDFIKRMAVKFGIDPKRMESKISVDDIVDMLKQEAINGGIETFEGSDDAILESRKVEGGFRSAAEDAIEKMPPKMSTESFIKYLKNNGVKDDEITHSGLFEAIEGKETVTKAEIQDAFANPELVKKTTPMDDEIEAESIRQHGVNFRELTNPGDRQLVLNQFPNMQKYQRYSIKGIGDNYREELTKLTDENDFMWREGFSPEKTNDGSWNLQKDGEFVYVNGFPSKQELYQQAQYDTFAYSPKTKYKSSHWDDPNVLYHTRKQDTVIDGEKTLLIEEIQSDWHQAGRKKGYLDGSEEEMLHNKNAEVDALDADYYEHLKNIGVNRYSYEAGQIWKKEYTPRIEEIRNKYAEAKRRLENGVPQAPYSKTWHEKAMKDVIDEAIANGYERVAWVNGKTSADRYSLAKQVDSISSAKLPTGEYQIQMEKNGNLVIDKRVKADELEASVGKEMAQKIVSDKEVDAGIMTIYRGLDLEVGGEGMKAFYDKILPDFTKKYIKKWGATVETKKLPDGTEVHSFPVTTKMVEDVTENGQLLYSLNQVTDTVKALSGKGDEIIEMHSISPFILSKSLTKALNTVNEQIYESIFKRFEGGTTDRLLRRYVGTSKAGFSLLDRTQEKAFVKKYRHLKGMLARGDIKAEDYALEINKLKEFVADEEELHTAVIQYLENPDARAALSAIYPELVPALDAVRDALNQISEDLMSRGIIKPSQFKKWEDRYLSRIYEASMSEEASRIVKSGMKMPDIKSGRKIESIIDYLMANPQEADRLGYKLNGATAVHQTIAKGASASAYEEFLRGVAYSEIVPDDAMVTMTADIENLPKRFSPYYAKEVIIPYLVDLYQSKVTDPNRVGTQQDIIEEQEILDTIEEIKKQSPQEYIVTKDTASIPKDRRYGAVAGLVLSSDVVSLVKSQFHIVQTPEMFADRMDMFGSALLTFFKMMKVPFNYFAYPRNLLTNWGQWTASGADPLQFPTRYAGAAKSYIKKDQWYKMAREEGMLDDTAMSTELLAALDMLSRSNDNKAIDFALKKLKKLASGYGIIDDLAKIARMQYAIEEEGKTTEEAIAIAQDTHFDYGLTYDLVRMIRDPDLRKGIIGKIISTLFVTYMQKSIAFIDESIRKRFATTALMGLALYMYLHGDDDEDRKKIDDYDEMMEMLPQFVKDNPFTKISMEKKDGETYVTVTDIGGIMPGAQILKAAYNVAQGAPLKALGTLGFGSSPLQMPGDLVNNQSSFTGKALYTNLDDWEKAKDIAGYFFTQFAPGTITSIQSLVDSKHPWQPKLLGVNSYTYSKSDLERRKQWDMREKAQDAGKEINKIKRKLDRVVSEDLIQEAIQWKGYSYEDLPEEEGKFKLKKFELELREEYGEKVSKSDFNVIKFITKKAKKAKDKESIYKMGNERL